MTRDVDFANVFLPAVEIRDPKLFAGRREELRAAVRALASEGSHIVLYGNRGVGKSSIARQIEAIARGNEEILQKLGIASDGSFDFMTVYLPCDDSTDSIDKLLLRLLTDESALQIFVPYRLISRSSAKEGTLGFEIKGFKLGGKGNKSVTEGPENLGTDVVSIFTNTIRKIVETNDHSDGVLIIVDEFDRIRNKKGIASLMKALGPQGVKFVLVGVATDVHELIRDHESVSRQLTDGTIRVPPMSDSELNDIFNNAEQLLDQEYHFSQEGRDWVISISRGHPFFVHLIGKHALFTARDKSKKLIDLADVETALEQIATGNSAPVQEGLYKQAVAHSYPREYILKAFAAVQDEEIHTTELYSAVSRQLKIDKGQVAVYVGQLTLPQYGEVLTKSRDRYYRFKDSLFKAYAAARPFQHSKPDPRK